MNLQTLDLQKAHCRDFLLRDVNSIQKTADELLDYAKNPSAGDADRLQPRLATELKEKLDRLMPAIECYTKNMLTIERERRKFKDLHIEE